MSVSYTDALSSYLGSLALYNEVQQSFNDWKAIISQSASSLFSENALWQSWSMWRGWQTWLETYCTSFINPDIPLKPDGSLNYYTLASWRVKAGLNVAGFTRKYKISEGVVGTAYGLCEDGDYIGPHLFNELQLGFGVHGDPEIPPPPDPPILQGGFLWTAVPATLTILTSAGLTVNVANQGSYQANGEAAMDAADSAVNENWPQGDISGGGFGSYCGAHTWAVGWLTQWNGGGQARVGVSTYNATATISEPARTEFVRADLWVMASPQPGGFNAYGANVSEGSCLVESGLAPDETGLLTSSPIGNLDEVLGGNGVAWGAKYQEGYDYGFFYGSMWGAGYQVTSAYFLIKWEITYKPSGS